MERRAYGFKQNRQIKIGRKSPQKKSSQGENFAGIFYMLFK